MTHEDLRYWPREIALTSRAQSALVLSFLNELTRSHLAGDCKKSQGNCAKRDPGQNRRVSHRRFASNTDVKRCLQNVGTLSKVWALTIIAGNRIQASDLDEWRLGDRVQL
jgi:hypothetical protein